jgi:hypothetical protein
MIKLMSLEAQSERVDIVKSMSLADMLDLMSHMNPASQGVGALPGLDLKAFKRRF